MDPNWAKKEAVATARDKCRQAKELLEEARSIFHETDHDVDHANAGKAIVYIDEVGVREHVDNEGYSIHDA